MEASMNAAASIGPFSIITPSAKEAVLIANTPSFLLDRLRKDIGVQTIVDNMSGADIVAALSATLAHPPKDPSEMVLAYVYLAALASSDPLDAELRKKISSLDLANLEWGNVIRSVILAEAVPTTTGQFSGCDNLRP
jgi:hypothetical protein